MKVLNLSECDYANASHENAKALRSIGVDCEDLVKSKHPFGYATEGKLSTIPEMIESIKKADVIQVMHSHPYLFELAKANSNAKIMVYHTGTRYREGHKGLSILFEGYTQCTDQSEFLAINQNLHYIVSPVEFDCAPLATEGRLRFAHYPSNPQVKGTDKILEMMNPFKLKLDFRVSLNTVDHATQLRRMANCDVYIELFKPELNGNPYGCFGVTALEASAMGRIVVTNNLHNKVYTDTYGRLPFTIANTEKAFTNTINGLLNLSLEMIRDMQKQTWEIMRENHSYKATGERILKVING